MHYAGRFGLAGLALGLAFAGVLRASALTREEAIENCRNTVGCPMDPGLG
jgi:hypothetical protein